MQRKVALIYPRGTCKTPTFYFRGGDGISEPEDLRIQYQAALDEHKAAKRKLAQAQAEYSRTTAELEDVDNCILKIAANMGSESVETTENANLRNRIQELQAEIDEVDKKIAETKQNCLPFEFSGLVNERAQYTPSLRDLRELTAVDHTNEIKRNIGELLLSQEFSESVESLIEKHVAIEVKSRMRSDVSDVQNRVNEQKSEDTGKVNEIDDEDFMMKIAELKDISLDALESQVQLDLAKMHRKVFLKMEIDRIDEMNEFLTLMNRSTIDTKEVYKNCVKEDEEEDFNQNDTEIDGIQQSEEENHEEAKEKQEEEEKKEKVNE